MFIQIIYLFISSCSDSGFIIKEKSMNASHSITVSMRTVGGMGEVTITRNGIDMVKKQMSASRAAKEYDTINDDFLVCMMHAIERE
jgi:hypothetical protein